MPGVGDPAPQFSGKDVLTGEPFSLAEHQGKVILVAFNGITWCGPCQFEAPILQDLWEEYNFTTPPHVQFVMVSWLDPQDKLPAKLQQVGITMPVLADPAIPTAYGINAVPKVFVVGTTGTICAIKLGAGPPADVLREELRPCSVAPNERH